MRSEGNKDIRVKETRKEKWIEIMEDTQSKEKMGRTKEKRKWEENITKIAA